MAVRITYQEMKDFAESKGWKILSDENEITDSTKYKIKFLCPNGHENFKPFSQFKCGKGCKQCYADKMRISQEDVEDLIESFGYQLVSTYTVVKNPLTLICPNGSTCYISYDNFTKWNTRCDCELCKRDKRIEKIAELNIIANEIGYKIITKEFIGHSRSLIFECDRGHQFNLSWGHFTEGQRCGKCYDEARMHSYEYVKNAVEDVGYKLISDTYEGVKAKLSIKCDNGHRFDMVFSSFLQGTRCPKCARLKNSGEGHYKWNPEKTDEDREVGRKYKAYQDWRIAVYTRDNYTCQCCMQHGGRLNAHHKDGYSWCVERRLDVENGVTLCTDCHKEFHSIYGTINITEGMFNEFRLQKKLEVSNYDTM